MKENRIAFVTQSSSFSFYTHVIENLPKDMVHIILRDKLPDSAEMLKEKGYQFHLVDKVNLEDYEFFVNDECDLMYESIFYGLSDAGKRFCCLRHSLDQGVRYIPKAHYSIRAHQRLARLGNAMENTVTRNNPDLLLKMTSISPRLKAEYAYTGPYHMGKWTKEVHTPKNTFRTELEAAIGQKISKEKPVVAFFLDEYGYDKSLILGLKNLAKHATIIYKGLEENDSRLLALGKSVIRWPSVGYAPNLLRFSADFILCGYYSSTFASSLMLGLPVLPYYTKQIYYKGRSCNDFDSFMRFMPKSSDMNINHRCIAGFGAVYDIEDTKRLVAAMNDSSFWNEYPSRLPEIQKSAFGDYCLQKADVKTAKLILRAFLTGTFGNAVNAIKFLAP